MTSIRERRLKLLSNFSSGLRGIHAQKHLLESTDYAQNAGIVTPVEILNAVSLNQTKSEHNSNQEQNRKSSITILKSQIGFLKVHKAASTTIQGILLRFGWKRNLTFVLPPEYNQFGYPNVISLYEPPNRNNTLLPPTNQTFDILCHHVFYNKKDWGNYLPLGYALIGSVREPWHLFKSMINYMNPWYIDKIQSNDKVKTFLLDPLKFEPKQIQFSVTNNRMSLEFGVDPYIIQTRDFKAFQDYLEQIGIDFDLVIVAERLDESLVLLRRYLNWSMQDILYASKNIRTNYKTKYLPREEDFPNFKNFSAFDYFLYNFFENKLDNKIQAEGRSFPKEVMRFREVRNIVENFCHKIPVNISIVTIPKSEWNGEIRLDRAECALLHKGEIEFTQEIRKRQYRSATWTFEQEMDGRRAIK